MTEQIHIRARKFLQEFFNDDEITTLCFDYFPQVYNNFIPGMDRNHKAMALVSYCQRTNRLDQLLAALERERSRVYAERFAEQPHLVAGETTAQKNIERNHRQIFVSHAHQDAEFAQRLAADLRANGWETWLAPDNIQPGEKWVEAINRGLTESGIFVLLTSGHALQSRWVKSETNAAISLEHRGKMQFVPLALEPVSTPPLWGNYQQILFYDDYDRGLQQLLHLFNSGKQDAERAVPAQVREPVVKSGSLPLIEVVSEPEKANDEQPDSFVHPITGKVMVLVPAGEFLYGKDKKRMFLDEFWIDKTPVTNAEYKRFLDANLHHRVPRAWGGILGLAFGEGKYQWDKRSRMYPAGKADHPVVLVDWYDAQAYATWAKMELPSEEQWEKAARGFEGRIYSWGDEWVENYCNTKESGIGGTTPVGYYSPKGDSPFGCVDMCGNVREWTNSLRESGSEHRVVRGGSWAYDQGIARAAYRSLSSPGNRRDDRGFRVVVVRRPPSYPDP
jgi:sulfatase modifying factor 1